MSTNEPTTTTDLKAVVHRLAASNDPDQLVAMAANACSALMVHFRINTDEWKESLFRTVTSGCRCKKEDQPPTRRLSLLPLPGGGAALGQLPLRCDVPFCPTGARAAAPDEQHHGDQPAGADRSRRADRDGR